MWRSENEESKLTKKGRRFPLKNKIFPPILKPSPLVEASPVGGFQQPSRRTPWWRTLWRSTLERGSPLVETRRWVPWRGVAVVRRVVTGLLQDGNLLGIPRLQDGYAASLWLMRSSVVPVRTSRWGVSPISIIHRASGLQIFPVFIFFIAIKVHQIIVIFVSVPVIYFFIFFHNNFPLFVCWYGFVFKLSIFSVSFWRC